MQSNSTLSLKQVMLKACCNYHQRKGFMSRNHLPVYPSFWGCHNTTWVSLKRKYNLMWSSGKGSLEVFERCYGDDSTSLDTMLQWLRQMREELPLPYSNVFLFCTLTGLRTNESFDAIRLIKQGDSSEHFKTYYQTSSINTDFGAF
jgi:hypothetical protein